MNLLKQFSGRGMAAALAAAVGLALIASGCSKTNSGGPSAVAPPAPPATSSTTEPAAPKIAVYIPLGDASDTKDVIVHPVSDDETMSPARSAIIALAADPDSGFAAGTHLLSIKLKDGLATLDFDQLPVDANGGEGNQSRALNAILMTLGQFSSISTVQILVNGNTVKDAGEFSLDSPLNVIRPNSFQQAQQPGGQEPG